MPGRGPIRPERVIKGSRVYVVPRAVPVPTRRSQVHGVAGWGHSGGEVRRKLADRPADPQHIATSCKGEHLVGCGIGGIRNRNRRVYNKSGEHTSELQSPFKL